MLRSWVLLIYRNSLPKSGSSKADIHSQQDSKQDNTAVCCVLRANGRGTIYELARTLLQRLLASEPSFEAEWWGGIARICFARAV